MKLPIGVSQKGFYANGDPKYRVRIRINGKQHHLMNTRDPELGGIIYESIRRLFPNQQYSKETQNKKSKAMKGRKLSKEHRKKLSESHIGIQAGKNHPHYGKTGNKHHNWKGGRDAVECRRLEKFKNNFDINSRKELGWARQYWANRVKARDNYTCQKCGSKKNLEAHHIVPIKQDVSKSLDEDNGITLCHDCHRNDYHRIFKNNSIEEVDFNLWLHEEIYGED